MRCAWNWMRSGRNTSAELTHIASPRLRSRRLARLGGGTYGRRPAVSEPTTSLALSHADGASTAELASSVAISSSAPAPLLSPRPAYALAFFSGLLYFLGFAGTDLWPLSLVALAPLLVALEGQPPRRALRLGGLTGFTMTMGGFYWLLEMLQTFSGYPTALCLVFMVILCAYQGGRIAMLGWLHARGAERGWPRSLVFCLAFVASELTFPLLFPWYFAASVHQVPALTQLAEIGGPYLVGLVLVAPSLALAELALARMQRRSRKRGIVLGGFAIPVLAALYGWVRVGQIDAQIAEAEPVRVGIVQGNQSLTPSRFERAESFRRHVQMTEELRDRGADLVVWSEAALLMGVPEEDYDGYLQRLFTRTLKVPTIIGTVLSRRHEGYSEAFNTALSVDREGRITGRYDKQYLLAFGEYIPFGDIFPFLYDWSPNSGRLKPGTSLAPLPYGEKSIATLICYEDILPSFVRGMVRASQPDLLVNLTNDAWFGDTTEPWIHLALAKFRTIEHRRYLVRATNSGVSAIVDPVGRVVAHGGTFQPEIIEGTAHFMNTRTVYELLGDAPHWLATFAAFAFAFVRRPSKTNKP